MKFVSQGNFSLLSPESLHSTILTCQLFDSKRKKFNVNVESKSRTQEQGPSGVMTASRWTVVRPIEETWYLLLVFIKNLYLPPIYLLSGTKLDLDLTWSYWNIILQRCKWIKDRKDGNFWLNWFFSLFMSHKGNMEILASLPLTFTLYFSLPF